MSDCKKNEVSPKSSPISHKRNEASISTTSKENQKNSTSVNCTGNIGLNQLLDGLIMPDVSSTGGYSEAANYMEESLVLALKKVPVSDFKRMVTLANGIFVSLNCLNIDYTILYDVVKYYINCCALLASTQDIKQDSTAEDVAAQYNLENYHETAREAFQQVSSKWMELGQQLTDKISDKIETLKKLETTVSVHESEHASRTLEKFFKKMKKLEDEMRHHLESLDKRKKICQDEKLWEAFMDAKGFLGL